MKIETDYRSPAQRFASDLARVIADNFEYEGTIHTRRSWDVKTPDAHVVNVTVGGVRFTVQVREGSHR